MTKLLVETTGDFMLVDAYTGDLLDSGGCSVVGTSQFIQARVSVGQVIVHLGNLRDDATTEEWKAYLKDSGDFALAKAAFESAFSLTAPPKPVGPSFEEIDSIVAMLSDDDFQKDGKPKVGAIKAAGLQINTEVRDAYWEWKTA